MGIEMNDEIFSDDDYEEFDRDEATPGICFYVLIDYNPNHRLVKKKLQEEQFSQFSDPISTHRIATMEASNLSAKVSKSYLGSHIVNIPPEEREDEYNTLIIDKHDDLICRIGVGAEDYRNVVIH